MPKAIFIGFQEDKDGNKLPLFNYGKDTWSASTLARKGIAIPDYPRPTTATPKTGSGSRSIDGTVEEKGIGLEHVKRATQGETLEREEA